LNADRLARRWGRRPAHCWRDATPLRFDHLAWRRSGVPACRRPTVAAVPVAPDVCATYPA
jgi:hypothetical protein